MADSKTPAGFVAESLVAPLDYTFAPYSKAAGTIKEPSDEQIAQFLRDIQKITIAATKAGVDKLADADKLANDPDAMLELLNSLDASEIIDQMAEMSGAYSKLCSGHPTPAQIQALPLRVRAHFFSWLQREVVSPEAGTGGTAPVVRLRPETLAG
jgi:hypothetical protein